MPTIHCVCGERLRFSDDAELLRIWRAHNDAAHADFPAANERVREAIALRAHMNPWDGERAALPGPVEIVPLSPERHDELLHFFDRDAFADNPAWGDCYCLFHSFAGSIDEWGKRRAPENRAEQSERVRSGRAGGWLARAGGRVVAWCHAAPRTGLPGLARDPALAVDDAERVGSIVCFVVAAPYRGQGLAKRLLAAACDGFRARGLAIAEAYPPRHGGNDARVFPGPLAMYLAAGFAIERETPRVALVRRAL